jgi:hypothetical protein
MHWVSTIERSVKRTISTELVQGESVWWTHSLSLYIIAVMSITSWSILCHHLAKRHGFCPLLSGTSLACCKYICKLPQVSCEGVQVHLTSLMHHASCIMHHASCIMHHASCIMHHRIMHSHHSPAAVLQEISEQQRWCDDEHHVSIHQLLMFIKRNLGVISKTGATGSLKDRLDDLKVSTMVAL